MQVATRSPRGAANARRAAANKKINQRLLREKIANGNRVTQIFNLIERVETIRTGLAKKKELTQGEQAKTIEELRSIKIALDARFRLLGKYLPDLRSIDFSDSDGNNPIERAVAAWAEVVTTLPSDDAP